MKKVMFAVILILLVLPEKGNCQFPDWKCGFQIKYGIAKFQLDDLNKWLGERYFYYTLEKIDPLAKIHRGSFTDISFIIKLNKFAAFSLGFMPKFKAEISRSLSYSSTALKIKTEAVPYYLACYLYMPVSYKHFTPYLTFRTGTLGKVEFKNFYKYESGETFDIISSNGSEQTTINYLSTGIGFDFRVQKLIVISSTIGYQFSKTHIYSPIPKDPELDFSGSFINIGMKFVL